jgi:hypothetical protein
MQAYLSPIDFSSLPRDEHRQQSNIDALPKDCSRCDPYKQSSSWISVIFVEYIIQNIRLQGSQQGDREGDRSSERHNGATQAYPVPGCRQSCLMLYGYAITDMVADQSVCVYCFLCHEELPSVQEMRSHLCPYFPRRSDEGLWQHSAHQHQEYVLPSCTP